MDLALLRDEIDKVDAEIVRLFVRRMEIAEEVASYKIESGLQVFQPSREDAVILRAQQLAGEKNADYAKQLFTLLMGMSRDMQNKLIENSKPASDL